jgi:hypothetical protein
MKIVKFKAPSLLHAMEYFYTGFYGHGYKFKVLEYLGDEVTAEVTAASAAVDDMTRSDIVADYNFEVEIMEIREASE